MRRYLLSRLSIRWALVFFLTLGIIVPVTVFSMLFTRNLNNYLRKIESESVQLTLKNNAQQLESAVESISYTAAYISNSSDVLEYLYAMQISPGSADATFAREYLIKYIRNLANATLYSLNPDISVITPTGEIIGLEYIKHIDNAEEVFAQAALLDSHSIWYNILSPKVSKDLECTWFIRDKNEVVALLSIRIPQKELWNRYSNHPILQYRQEIYYQDRLICYNDDTGGMKESESTVLETPIKIWGMKLVVQVPTNILVEGVSQQNRLFFWYFIVLVVFLMIVINIISDYMCSPIKYVVAQMQRLQLGNFTATPTPNSFQEINLLSENLNEVSDCIQGLMTTAAEQASLKESMHYEALMAQINPHFLYNTLNSIKWLSIINGNTVVAEMLSKLGNILHYSFGKKEKTILLKHELEFISDYVVLLKMRYGNAIEFFADIPTNLLELYVPRFCIQPIIENSITHGVFSSVAGQISLTAQEINDQLVLTIRDNGVGMEQEKADMLLKGQAATKQSSGIGLYNVQQRIMLLYGHLYGIDITTSPGNGCVIRVRLPLER